MPAPYYGWVTYNKYTFINIYISNGDAVCANDLARILTTTTNPPPVEVRLPMTRSINVFHTTHRIVYRRFWHWVGGPGVMLLTCVCVDVGWSVGRTVVGSVVDSQHVFCVNRYRCTALFKRNRALSSGKSQTHHYFFSVMQKNTRTHPQKVLFVFFSPVVHKFSSSQNQSPSFSAPGVLQNYGKKHRSFSISLPNTTRTYIFV